MAAFCCVGRRIPRVNGVAARTRGEFVLVLTHSNSSVLQVFSEAKPLAKACSASQAVLAITEGADKRCRKYRPFHSLSHDRVPQPFLNAYAVSIVCPNTLLLTRLKKDSVDFGGTLIKATPSLSSSHRGTSPVAFHVVLAKFTLPSIPAWREG